MAKKLNKLDLLALNVVGSAPTGFVVFAAKTDGLYQKIGSVESKLSTTADLLDMVKTPVPTGAKFTDTIVDISGKSDNDHNHTLLSLIEKSYNSLTDRPELGTASSKNTGITEGDIPILGIGGKLNEIVIPKIAISNTHIVGTQINMLALTAYIGDVAIRTDLNKSYILKGIPASELNNWQELVTPTSSVQSVAGRTGTVVITKADVGLGNTDDTPDLDKPISNATQVALDVLTERPLPDPMVTLTEDEYDALSYKDPDTYYLLVED